MAKEKKPVTSKSLAVMCARIADEKIASDIILLNLKKVESPPTDYFVICTCNSDTQVRAVTEAVLRKCSEIGITKPRIEGYETGYWVLADFFDVVFHIMQKQARQYYNLEKLWGDAQFFSMDEKGIPKKINKFNLLG